ncbi:AFG1/ZapE family ATPase [Caedibacter taeniospiralis]|uniref:AFG1/ZapE family ATPase n=1 Tax=Caedibacter taeniospiralis TaxID=28907 RepID=UPI000C2706DB|nr:AFG1/ZapE family ATPase [Caedibacter taeniospiralis]
MQVSKILKNIRNNSESKATELCEKHKVEFRFKCPTCVKEHEADKLHEAKLEKRIKDSGLAKRQLQANFANFKSSQALEQCEACQSFADNWEQVFTHGQSMLMIGGVGTGKTHLASSIANQVMAKHYAHVRYTTFMMMTFAMRDAQNLHPSLTGVINQFTKPELLIIDEIGVKGSTEYEFNLLNGILDTRYAELLPTILITNANWNQLVSMIGYRAISRFTETGKSLKFGNGDYRKILAGGAA